MVRAARLVIVFGLGLAACRGEPTAAPAPDPAALRAQQELIARRDALLVKRQALSTQSTQLGQQIAELAATGGDTRALSEQKAAVDREMQGQDQELAGIRTSVETTLAQVQRLAKDAKGADAVMIAGREAVIGDRERGLAQREAVLADRERGLAQREAQLAVREKETCGAAAPPIIVQQLPAPRGQSYTRKEIEPLLSRARTAMARKGLLALDLGPAAGLEAEATRAMSDADWGKAYLAATQLAATVEAVKIDRAFITAKYGRLNARASSGKLDDATSAALTEGMRDVLQRYGDGDFAAANKRLNQLWALAGIR